MFEVIERTLFLVSQDTLPEEDSFDSKSTILTYNLEALSTFIHGGPEVTRHFMESDTIGTSLRPVLSSFYQMYDAGEPI